MSLLDLSLVTSALMRLLDKNINKVIDTAAGVTVTPASPDSVGTVMKTLSLYMYHLGEEAQYKNLVGPGNDPRNIARSPMGLCLYYILTAHHDTDVPADALVQQKLMGYALKTLHDYPLLFDGTVIDGTSILGTALVGNDNPVQIVMRPVGPEESVSFWGAEDSKTARLSAYYEVRVILLEPDEPATIPAPVLSLGTYLYQLGTAHLDCTRSQLEFVLPAAAGGDTQTLTSSPARACVVGSPHNRLTVLGTNLTLGKSRQLWLRTARWTAIPSPAGTGGPIPIDLSLAGNAGWALSVQPDQLILDIDATLAFVNNLGVETSIDVFPGIYTAFLRTTIDERIVYGEVEPFTVDSNEIPLIVIPRITGATVDGPNNRITLTIVDFNVDFGDGTNDALDIRLIVDGQTYLRGWDLVVPIVNDGRFETVDPSTLTFQARFNVNLTGDHPCRVVVNGAESAPFWIEIP
jgi:hypothetical protein